MSIFDLFRGFFRVPGGQREPFFDGLTHEDDDDDDAEDGFDREYLDRFDDAFRFSFSLGPNGMHIEEPQTFGQIFRDMEEIFAGLGNFRHDMPSIEAPPQESRREESSRDSLRDYMLKKPDDSTRDAPRDVEPPSPRGSNVPRRPFHHWTPFSRDIWSDGPRQRQGETKEDSDLDSQVSSEGLDQILSRAPPQPKTRSFFQSVTVTKVVKPDGTVEERRTVRDGQGNEETTVTRSGGPGSLEGRRDDPASPSAGGHGPFSDMPDETTMFSKFFGRFRS